MDQPQLEGRIREIAVSLFPSANDWAVSEGVRNVCRFFESVNPGEYAKVHRALFSRDASIKDYESICQIRDRLERLAVRLNDDGRYTDANICWLALSEMDK